MKATLISTAGLAEQTGLDRHTIARKARLGQIPGRIGKDQSRGNGRGYKFNIADARLARWIEDNRVALV